MLTVSLKLYIFFLVTRGNVAVNNEKNSNAGLNIFDIL